MSKAFTREDDGGAEATLPEEEEWPFPDGARNYVTPAGAAALREELERLRAAPRQNDAPKRLQAERRMRALVRRLEHMEVVDPAAQPADQVRFGATVTVRDDEGGERDYRIVGLDEADARRGWVSWLSPLARALVGARPGDLVTLRLPRGEQELEIVAIRYE